MPQLSRSSRLTRSALDTKCALRSLLKFLSRTFLAPTIISRVMFEICVEKAHKSSRNVAVFFVQMSNKFWYNPQHKNSWKYFQRFTNFVHAYRRADRATLLAVEGALNANVLYTVSYRGRKTRHPVTRIYTLLLPVCTAATPVKAVCKYCSCIIACESNSVSTLFLYDMSRPIQFLNLTLPLCYGYYCRPIVWEMRSTTYSHGEKKYKKETERERANWIGHILHTNCLLKRIIEGKRRRDRSVGKTRKKI